MMVRKKDARMVKNCKVIPGEAAVGQHRLLVMDMLWKEKVLRKKAKGKGMRRLKLWNLKGDKAMAFKSEVMGTLKDLEEEGQEEALEEQWRRVESRLIKAAEKVCGRTKRGKKGDKGRIQNVAVE